MLAKKAAPAPAANRNNALDKWEKEVRESAAKKKAATAGGVLSKADQALVAQQTKVEADVRAKMQTVKEQMARGLAIIRSLIAADVEPFKANLTEVLQLIMDGPLDQGSFLVSEDAFNTFLVSRPGSATPAPTAAAPCADLLCAAPCPATAPRRLLRPSARVPAAGHRRRHPAQLRHVWHPRAVQRGAARRSVPHFFLPGALLAADMSDSRTRPQPSCFGSSIGCARSARPRRSTRRRTPTSRCS